MSKTVKYLLASQILLAVAIVICTIILPQFLFSRDQGGMSNYGVHHETIVPFTVGFAGAGILICLAALMVPPKTAYASGLRASLLSVGLACLLMVLTTYTYKLSHTLDLLHIYSAQSLGLIEAAIGTWYAKKLVKDRFNNIVLAIFAVGFLLGIFTVAGLLHVLFVAEALTAFSFGAIMVHTVRHLTK